MKCYRNGSCGPYESRSCSQCPASKPSYRLKRSLKSQNPEKPLNPQNAQKRYEMFKLQWMIDHGHTLKELIHELTEYMEDRNLEMSPEDVFGEWESGRGFGSEIWPCFQEYLDSPESAEE